MLETIRNNIDRIDDEIVNLFTERLKLVEEVAREKKEKNLPILNTAREREIVNRLTKDQNDTTAGYIKILFTTIFDLSRSHQAKLLHEPSKISTDIRNALESTPILK